MKRILFLTVCLFIVNFCAWGDTVTKVYLSHNGKLTQYKWTDWQTVLNDAVAGDTIFLTEGTFNGDITIDKPVTIIGAGVGNTGNSWMDGYWKDLKVSGQGTFLFGNITIDIPESVSLEASLLENVRVRNIFVNESVDGLIIKKCFIDGEFKADALTTNVTFINCYTYEFYCQNLENANIYNCLFDWFYGNSAVLADTFSILNTIVIELKDAHNFSFVNSGFCDFPDSNSNSFDHCICRVLDSNQNAYNNCYYAWEVQNMSKEEILSNGWLGVDGTAIGYLGGYYPFTLKPSQPYVSESSLSVSEDAKTLNVTLKVSSGQ